MIDEERLSFTNGEYVTRTLQPGELLYRSPNSLAEPLARPGRFWGLENATRAGQAEAMYNIHTYGNELQVIRTYQVTKPVDVYFGSVSGGTGYQVLFPKGVNPGSVLNFIGEHPLK